MRQTENEKDKKYYQKMRNDPVRWAKRLEMDKRRKEKAKKLAEQNPERQAELAEMACERQRRFKERKAAEELGLPVPSSNEAEKRRKKIERSRRHRERHREELNARQRAKYLTTRAVEKKAMLTPEERAERRRLSSIKYTALRTERNRLARLENPKPSGSKQALAISGASRRMSELNNYSTDSRLMGISEAAAYLELNTLDLIMAGMKGEAPRPVGILQNGETAYTITDIRDYKHQRKEAT